jgi:hypothetical protein
MRLKCFVFTYSGYFFNFERVSQRDVQIILWGSRREKCSNSLNAFLFSAVCKSNNIRGTPAQLLFINGGPHYILGFKNCINTENE